MTTILCCQTKDGVWLASDTQATAGNGSIQYISKVIEKGNIILAFAGNAKIIQIFDKINFPPVDDEKSCYDFCKYFASEIVDIYRMYEGIIAEVIVVKNGQACQIISNGYTLPIKLDTINGIGSGSKEAVSYFEGLANDISIADFTVDEVKSNLQKSLEYAIKHDAYSGGSLDFFFQATNAYTKTQEKEYKFKINNISLKGEQIGVVEGIASSDDIDIVNERITGSALSQMANTKNLPMLYHHNANIKLGDIVELEHLKSNNKNELKFTAELNLSNTNAKTIYNQLKDGKSYGISIGFNEKKAEYVNGIKEITEAELIEISFVKSPKNSQARITNVKGITFESRKDVEKFLHSKGFSNQEATSCFSAIKEYLTCQGNLDKLNTDIQGNLESQNKDIKIQELTKTIQELTISLQNSTNTINKIINQ